MRKFYLTKKKWVAKEKRVSKLWKDGVPWKK